MLCGACVEVCPTGAHMDKGLPWKKKAALDLAPVILPPENRIEFTAENIEKVPEVSGVYQLIDENHAVILIRGAENVARDLREKLKSVGKARFFRYEEHGMYTMRETELLEKFLKMHGRLPEVNDEISDLYQNLFFGCAFFRYLPVQRIAGCRFYIHGGRLSISHGRFRGKKHLFSVACFGGK